MGGSRARDGHPSRPWQAALLRRGNFEAWGLAALAAPAPAGATILDMQDYYNLLGVAPGAAPEAIRRAFRARAKEVHPDAHPHLPPERQEALRRRFIALAQAYETLSDPARRADYDRRLRRARPASGAAPGAAPNAGTGPEPGAASGPAGWRSTRARFGSARRAPPHTQPASESLDDLLRDVEALLGRFGLDLRPPFEALLEALLDWARAVFRAVAGADAPAGADSSGAAGASREAGEPAGAGTAGRSSGHATGRSSAQFAGGARRARPGAAGDSAKGGAKAASARVEAELDALRKRVRRGAPGGDNAAADVEAELRRLKERLGRRD
jgi:curved DNA-binding protein CbpA